MAATGLPVAKDSCAKETHSCIPRMVSGLITPPSLSHHNYRCWQQQGVHPPATLSTSESWFQTFTFSVCIDIKCTLAPASSSAFFGLVSSSSSKPSSVGMAIFLFCNVVIAISQNIPGDIKIKNTGRSVKK